MWNRTVKRGNVPAPWCDHVNDEENQRLATIEDRLERKMATVEELLAERRRIMHRAIRRMRRAEGKD